MFSISNNDRYRFEWRTLVIDLLTISLAWFGYSPKQASLISVLSVLCIIFTTNITANGVRNEIACKEK